jgi:hypothetical protein
MELSLWLVVWRYVTTTLGELFVMMLLDLRKPWWPAGKWDSVMLEP